MSIKKYHVSKNLCQVTQDNCMSYTDAYFNYTVFNDTLQTTGNVLCGFYIAVTPNTTYTANAVTNKGNPLLRIREYSAKPASWQDDNFITQSVNQNFSANPATFTTTNDTHYVLLVFFVSETLAPAIISDIMLNTGSTALPYEPYGNTWNSIPYHKYGTETDSITTLPTPVIGDGTNATAVIEGNMQQATTPTPSAPVYPSECGERTANLCEVSQNNCIIYSSYSNFTIVGNEIHTTGNTLCGFIVKVSPNTTYTVNGVCNKQAPQLRIREYSSKPTTWNDDFIGQSVSVEFRSAPATFTTSNETEYILVTVYASANVAPVIISNIMLNTGSTALPYEPYGYKLPVISGGTTTPVYLGEVQSYRAVKKLVFDGTETGWTFPTGTVPRARITLSDTASIVGNINQTPISSHYIGRFSDNNGTVRILVDGVTLNIADSVNAVDSTTWTTYLQQQYSNGTPVTIWYVLATPTTGIVNEPIRKIGDYADSVSANTIPTTSTESTFDVDTTLKPSKVELTYHGWHPHSDKKANNGQWD